MERTPQEIDALEAAWAPSKKSQQDLWGEHGRQKLRRRDQLVAALHARAARMFRDGLVDEVAALRDRGLEQGRTARAAIGYAQALDVLRGDASVEDAVEATGIATRKYARRQVSWFRRYAEAEELDVTGADRDGLTAVARRIVP